MPAKLSRSGGTKGLPSGYRALLEDLKVRVRSAQAKAALSVNRTLIDLYWNIGKAIVKRQRDRGWGSAVVERLARDLQREFPGTAGFSPRNIWRMRSFYLAWTGNAEMTHGVTTRNLRQILPQAATELPWFHNVVLIEKLKDPDERLWYARQTVVHGWSRSMLLHWIDSRLYARQGKGVTNFTRTLPPSQSDLALEVMKDPFTFDFLSIRAGAAERDLERGLLEHIRRFLLELGAGFAFVGQQVHLDVGGEDFYLDLLFYHLTLRSYVVIDLKARPFKPEFAGKMNFYLSAVDDRLRHPDDKPSIGLILCKVRSRVIAEYALRDLAKPVGVARYVTKLVESLPAGYRDVLPTTRQLETELRRVRIKPSS